ncbi:UDP-N-acetylmuramate--L-alanine ligase [candidate division GN15 bacterium]|uniref:UDP-N-acetylmuramate--L-alanine ligase n=1 Tax=candidate division GN15 bacterium TaxID=2072418 RepID=A0A855X9U6_9BACT|nr:MAG: UDP-N-acetylmuramate--L-alanine ligase [candidate division GN15 bacterium]
MFGRFRKLHFVGIGGAGMSGIAEILHNLGFEVTGSDSTPSEITEYLASTGIRIQGAHVAENVAQSDVVVISSAISDTNPEVAEARRRGIPVIKRAEMLGEIMRLKFSIGVAGTHGKTTTTSMIGKILRQANLNPTLIVGGVVAELGTGAALGSGDYLVAEADEYDKSFLAMFPSMSVVLNVEPDHLECYNGMEDLLNSFLAYINRVPFYGSAIISAEDPNTQVFRPRISRPYATFGFSNDADYRAVNLTMEPNRSVFSVYRRQQLLGEIILRVPGRHNVANALAAIAATSELDVPFPAIADALRDFRGVGRRFEFIAEVNGVTIIDDYAHHPSEIKATLAAARVAYPGRRVIAVFQPHLFSRTKQFVNEFAQTLSAADLCILTDIYPARELPIPGVTSELIKAAAEKSGQGAFRYVGVKDNAVEAIAETAHPGDVVILIGAGSITYIKHVVAEKLRGK